MERKRLLGLGLFGLLSVFLLSSGVLAETLAEKFTGGGASDILTSLQDSQLFSRFLIFVLVALIVYAVSQALPFFEADNLKWIRGLVAVVVAILATLYLEDFEVTTIVFSYSAFGIALSAIFPFFLIAIVSKKLHDGNHGYLSYFIWALFIIVMILRIVFVAEWDDVNGFAKVTYVILVLGAVGMFIFEKNLFRFLRREHNKDVGEKAAENIESSAKMIKGMSDFAKGAAGAKP